MDLKINQIVKDGIYDTTSLAEVLGISEVTARFYCRTGRITAQKVGKGWKVLGRNLIDFLKSRKKHTPTKTQA